MVYEEYTVKKMFREGDPAPLQLVTGDRGNDLIGKIDQNVSSKSNICSMASSKILFRALGCGVSRKSWI